MKKYGLSIVTIMMVMLIGCESTSQNEKLYNSGLKAIAAKSYPQAIGILSGLGDYKKSREMVSQLRYIVNGDYIGAGNFLVAAIKNDGTIAYSGGYKDSLSTESWKGVKTISTRGEYIEALDESGKISTTCPWTYEELQASTVGSTAMMSTVIQEMPKLERVSSFQSEYPRSVTALLKNGTVKVVNPSMKEEDIAIVNGWKDTVALAINGVFEVGVKADGSVVAAGEVVNEFGISDWKDIVALSSYVNATNVMGLKEDGTVVAASENRFGERDVNNWTDIIAIAAGAHHSVGLKRDGTVIATGDNSLGQRNVEGWTDIVAIDASWNYTLGLKSDGTLVLAGDYSSADAAKPDVTTITGVLVPTIENS